MLVPVKRQEKLQNYSHSCILNIVQSRCLLYAKYWTPSKYRNSTQMCFCVANQLGKLKRYLDLLVIFSLHLKVQMALLFIQYNQALYLVLDRAKSFLQSDLYLSQKRSRSLNKNLSKNQSSRTTGSSSTREVRVTKNGDRTKVSITGRTITEEVIVHLVRVGSVINEFYFFYF